MSPYLHRLIWILVIFLPFVGPLSASPLNEEPERVTVCQLKNDPASYNHHLVELTAFVSHDFEDFSVFDPACESRFDIWLAYGGSADSNTMYCCPGRPPSSTRPQPLAVEGISIPLVDDENFRAFEQMIQPPFRSGKYGAVAHATMVGRFFAGRQDRFGGKWGGYGHMGCCSLLAIQEIHSVDLQDRGDLDYGASPDQPSTEKKGCDNYRFLVPLDPSKEVIEAQHNADLGQRPWAFDDAERVASDELASLLAIPQDSIKNLKSVRTGQGRIVYQWKPGANKLHYLVVVSRPYWLSFYSQDAKKVAWVVIAAYAVCER